MDKLKHKEHDFSSKLRQNSVIVRLRGYINWHRNRSASGSTPPLPVYGPVSINLDLTSACNFSCPHCVDSKIINTGESLETESVKKTLDANCNQAGIKHQAKGGTFGGIEQPQLNQVIKEFKDSFCGALGW